MIKINNSTFTIDVEDGISIAMRDAFSVQSPQTNRVVQLTKKILCLLDRHDVKATFFVLGVVAENFPELVKKISEGGHELGVHGYNHLQFFRMNRGEAFQELDRAKKLIEDISGKAVYGHRAPAFSITPKTKWGLDVIVEAGFEYDSSIMPIHGKRYGWPGFTKDICRIKTPAGHQLIEVPLSTLSIMGREIPVCGGGYLRLFPEGFTRLAMKKITKERPAIVYIHPYELDTEPYPDYYFEQLNRTGFLNRNKMKSMWVNRKSVYPKLSGLLENYEFEPLINIVQKHSADEAAIKI
ncbi:polysaccharide deacetylase family protein [Rhodohalobacter sp. 8-1]|uniref:polysaccharide deacetylase family protein n=1 Tax=Rhodohalobacter sp. 8-1 TaxID=3131972 RepID=UPI0030EF6BA2